jgi:hypothetical protein
VELRHVVQHVLVLRRPDPCAETDGRWRMDLVEGWPSKAIGSNPGQRDKTTLQWVWKLVLPRF